MQFFIISVVMFFCVIIFGWSGFGVCDEWNRKTLFTLGRFNEILGPGLYFYIPFLQRVRHTIDIRIITYVVLLQKGLTKDNIPVEVDAIIFYRVNNVKLAVLNVDNYHSATQLAVCSSVIASRVYFLCNRLLGSVYQKARIDLKILFSLFFDLTKKSDCELPLKSLLFST